MTAFDDLRAVVAPGDGTGVVARFPGLLAVADGPDDAVAALLAVCRECAGDEPGRALARRLAAWLSGGDGAAGLRFGAVARTERGLGVFLRGPVDLLVPGHGTAITGADAATWTDRMIDEPDTPLTLVLQGTAIPAELVAGVYDLWEGVVPGGGVVAVAAGGAPGGAVPGLRAEDPGRSARHRRRETGEQPVVAPPEGPAGAGRGDPVTAGTPADPAREAPVPDGPAPDPDGPLPDDPAADPAASTVPDEAAGPSGGLLVLDDGTTLVVETDCLLGREPEADARVRAGALRAVPLEDPSGAMSRVHAELRVEAGDVLLADAGSSNGTYVAEPGAEAWTPLSVGRPVRLVPGTRVQVGQRTFTFETVPGGG